MTPAMKSDRAENQSSPPKGPGMNPNKALWEKGDFTRIAETFRESGEALVKGFGITQGKTHTPTRLLPFGSWN